ncbi:MAG: GH116 family glycosyl hydrolase [Anaerolineae bacterium]|nr:GH116 family glycosyl hydrolase [Anaerolineae bacterium]MDW8102328.1 GH116 family glycosyl hydrolase [Anaerolineae bacterium]
MRVAVPLEDGSLRVNFPNASSLYDTGNLHLFVTFDGLGGVNRAILTDGTFLGRWSLQITAGGHPLSFQTARALGRLWELEGEVEECHVTLTSFLSEKASIFQRCSLHNRSPQRQSLKIRLRWSPHLPVSWRERTLHFLANWIPKLIGKKQLWEEGWAKVFLPSEVRLRLQGGQIEVEGPRRWRWVWQGNRVPEEMLCTGKEVVLEYALEIPAGGKEEIVWSLGPTLEGLNHWVRELESAQNYARWLQRVASSGSDPLTRSLIAAGLNTALSVFKELGEDFAGFTAGPEYFYPPRLYFRDGYWTAQVVLPWRPDLVKRHLFSLARGVHSDGRCPSGVFPPDLLGDLIDWLPNHLDSPSFFVLLLADYLRFTEDWDILKAPVGEGKHSLWILAQKALAYLSSQDHDGDGLLEKPWKPNDWADNIRRSVWVTYDQALYVAALRAGAVIASRIGQEALANHYRAQAEKALEAMDRYLWIPEHGYYVNYLRPDCVEMNFSIDTLIAIYFGLTDEEKSSSLLKAARRLQTRFNEEQPFGDWGVMCVFPPYQHKRDLFGKSVYPYCYHNGADWPFWDGVYGAILLEQGDEDAWYVLTRWWKYGLERGWLTPVEYYSPPYPEGGKLQGWSSMPAAALLSPHTWTIPSRFLGGSRG